MPLIEAVLMYRPQAGGEGVPLGRTGDARALRVLRVCLLKAARSEADFWTAVDPGVAALRQAEAERLTRVLDTLLPEPRPGAPLRVLPHPHMPGEP